MTILKLQGMQPTANLTNGAMSLSLTSSSSQCCNSGTKEN
ncbi:class III lanthipeptide [Deinococcus xianganensis]|nr:class III lanthipeptide [Deinococcus xianganensis]